MPAIRANLGRFSWGGPNPGTFTPTGKVIYHGDLQSFTQVNPVNPLSRTVRKPPSVRLFVGFNVAGRAKWGMADLKKIVERVRTKQMKDPSATFVAQTGIYRHFDVGGKRGRVVSEDGAQVLIMNMSYWNVTTRTFRKQMIELAETICRELRQETVIAEWSEPGKETEEWVVTP